MNITNERLARGFKGWWLAALLLPYAQAQDPKPEPPPTTNESPSVSRFSDQPIPLRLEGFPERPRPIFEWGDHFLRPGNLAPGFTLPTGAHWSPGFWVFGDYRTAVQSFDPGYAPRRSEWANRLDLFANLQLAGVDRVLVGFRPIDRFEDGEERFSGYNFEPSKPKKYHGWRGEWRGEPTTAFFEAELGELFPALTKGDKHYLDYGFSIGRQPLILQDGLLVNDDILDMIGITRNTVLPKGVSDMRLTGFFAWNEVDRADNREDPHAYLFGLDTRMDFFFNTVEATMLYVTSENDGDGFYAGAGTSQRFGKFNTLFRVATSVAVEKESARVRNGTVLFSELSFEPEGSHNMVYLNAYLGIDEFSSAVRAPTAGGPLGRVGILNEASALGRYGSPLSNYSDESVGANLGYQMFFGMIPRTQFTIEIGGRAPLENPILPRDEAAGGIAARFQKAYRQRFVLKLDAFNVLREHGTYSYGGRVELHTKF
jgi:hypothetical protein